MEASRDRWGWGVRLDGPTDRRVVGDVLPKRRGKKRRTPRLTTTDAQGMPIVPEPTSKSSPWWALRAQHLRLYPECRICGETDHVHVHHLRYRGKRGLTEQPGDLVTLCSDHHDEFHRTYGRAGDIKAGKDGLARLTIAFIEAKRRLPL